jgi:hypothetical protein
MSSWAILNFPETVNPSLITAATDTTHASSSCGVPSSIDEQGFHPLMSEDLYFDVHASIYVR